MRVAQKKIEIQNKKRRRRIIITFEAGFLFFSKILAIISKIFRIAVARTTTTSKYFLRSRLNSLVMI